MSDVDVCIFVKVLSDALGDYRVELESRLAGTDGIQKGRIQSLLEVLDGAVGWSEAKSLFGQERTDKLEKFFTESVGPDCFRYFRRLQCVHSILQETFRECMELKSDLEERISFVESGEAAELLKEVYDKLDFIERHFREIGLEPPPR